MNRKEAAEKITKNHRDAEGNAQTIQELGKTDPAGAAALLEVLIDKGLANAADSRSTQ